MKSFFFFRKPPQSKFLQKVSDSFDNLYIQGAKLPLCCKVLIFLSNKSWYFHTSFWIQVQKESFPFLKEDMERLWSFIFQPWHAFQRCDFSFLTFNLNSSHQNLYQDNIPTTNSAIHLSSFHTKCVWCQTRPLFIVADHFEC